MPFYGGRARRRSLRSPDIARAHNLSALNSAVVVVTQGQIRVDVISDDIPVAAEIPQPNRPAIAGGAEYIAFNDVVGGVVP